MINLFLEVGIYLQYKKEGLVYFTILTQDSSSFCVFDNLIALDVLFFCEKSEFKQFTLSRNVLVFKQGK